MSSPGLQPGVEFESEKTMIWASAHYHHRTVTDHGNMCKRWTPSLAHWNAHRLTVYSLMKTYDLILVDADDTLFDFSRTERDAINGVFDTLPCDVPAAELKERYHRINKYMVWILGYMSPIMKEILEMFYQNQSDYIFDSSKFEKRFGIQATPYHIGIKQVLENDYLSKIKENKK